MNPVLLIPPITFFGAIGYAVYLAFWGSTWEPFLGEASVLVAWGTFELMKFLGGS